MHDGHPGAVPHPDHEHVVHQALGGGLEGGGGGPRGGERGVAAVSRRQHKRLQLPQLRPLQLKQRGVLVKGEENVFSDVIEPSLEAL